MIILWKSNLNLLLSLYNPLIVLLVQVVENVLLVEERESIMRMVDIIIVEYAEGLEYVPFVMGQGLSQSCKQLPKFNRLIGVYLVQEGENVLPVEVKDHIICQANIIHVKSAMVQEFARFVMEQVYNEVC